MSGGTGEARSRQLLKSVMWRVFLVNVLAAVIGQEYSDLIRSRTARSVVASPLAAVLGAVVATVALLGFALPRARRLVRSEVSARHALAVAAVLLVTLGGGQGLARPSDIAARSRLANMVIDIPGAMIWMAAVAPLAWRRARESFSADLAWLDDERAPTATERQALVRLPARVAIFTLPYWFFLAVLNLVSEGLTPKFGFSASTGVFFGVLLTWSATAAISYLLAERRLRPAFAEAFRATPLPELATVGIRKRLLAAWGLGSGIPLLFVMTTPAAMRTGGALHDVSAVVGVFTLLGAVGLVAGYLTIRAAARSLAEPVEDVRRGLERVRRGDLTTELDIDDAGEVGLVKVGFNEMVAGLRERALLEDLFGRHVGPDVARRAVEEGAALGGEQREISVFFVDIIGSTVLAEASSPTDVVALLNRFFAAVVHTVSAEGGWVNKFEGDGALCVFGAPAAQADHAARALRAACELRNALVDVADAGIGIATGDAVVGNVGAEERYEYTVVGRPVNAASRLTAEAKRRPTRVLATADAIASAGGEASSWTEVGFVELRGLAGPVLAYEPLATPLRPAGETAPR
jgi:adenylate cyclase